MRIAIASDEISFDFETAVSLGMEWGIDSFELKRLNRNRIPDVEEKELKIVEDVLSSTGATLTSLSPGLFKDSLTVESVEHEIQRLDRTIELAHRFGLERIIVFGFERDDGDRQSRLAEIIDVLGVATERTRSEGLMLCLENEPAFWADCPDTAVEIARAIDSPAFRLNWDPCNSLGCACGAPYPDGYELAREFVAHCHVKDARLKADGSVEYVLLGQGDMDWVGQFRALIRDGYQGYCVLEPHFGNRVASSRAAAKAVREILDRAHTAPAAI